jgi:hypothetical protein
MPIVVKAKLLSLAFLVCVLAGCFGCQRPDPNVAHMVQPEYPVAARLKDVQGVVRLGIVIEIDGKVSSVVGSGADPILIKSAEENARQWIWGSFPPRFQFPYYHEIVYIYELQGKPKTVIFPPTVKTHLPDRIEIIATRYFDDLVFTPVPAAHARK